jgi:hypothetical protein
VTRRTDTAAALTLAFVPVALTLAFLAVLLFGVTSHVETVGDKLERIACENHGGRFELPTHCHGQAVQPNEDAWRQCVTAAQQTASGDVDYQRCDALYDPHETFRY